jgi:hypothetical protein
MEIQCILYLFQQIKENVNEFVISVGFVVFTIYDFVWVAGSILYRTKEV